MILKRLSPNFGIQANIDLINLEEKQINQLISLLVENQILLIKGQSMSLSQQIKFTQKLGKIEIAWEDQHPKSEYVQYLSNLNRKYPNFKSSSKYWHTDRSFCDVSSKYTVLHAVNISLESGATQFCNMRQGYDTLPIDLQSMLNDLSAIHSFNYKFPSIMQRKGFAGEKIEKLSKMYPDIVQPLVKLDNFTKKKALYLSELCLTKIEGLQENQSRRLLNKLYKKSLVVDGIYNHLWETGDVLIWDNESLLHRATDTPASVLREFHRTTTMVDKNVRS